MKKFEFSAPGAHVIWDTKPATETGYAGYDFVHMDACFEENVHFSPRFRYLSGKLFGYSFCKKIHVSPKVYKM